MAEFIDFRFDATSEEVIEAAEEAAAEMITEITRETEENIRNLIAEAVREGIPPHEAARSIRDMIGLTSAQGQAALKYRAQLIENGLAPETVEAKVARYANELLNSRAEMIARTEIMDALNSGQNEAWLQAQEEGLLSEDATKVWIITEGACEICEPMDGKTVPIGESFPEGDPPLHPRCRCTIGIGRP